jgi:uncharacterized membrane protein YdjX (TVP38/TMEM64 family)
MPSTPSNPDDANDQAAPAPGRGWIKGTLFGAVLVGLFALSQLLDFESGIQTVHTWIESLGMWGPLVFVLLYILGTILMVPGAIPTVMAGALFGGLWGTVYASIGSTVGAALSFLIARYLARDSIGRWLAGKPGLARIDTMTLTHGALIVCIVRLVPLIPFNLVNYAFGITHVRFWRYALTSWICMLPGTFLYAAGTDVVLESVRSGDVPWLALAGVAAALVLVVLLGRKAAGRLRTVEAQTPATTTPATTPSVAKENV